MNKYRTVAEYQSIARDIPFKELEGLLDTYIKCSSLGARDRMIRTILNDEIERRFLA